ncbi:MAG: TIGR02281 family clan AA aspartic protease [Thioalkalivibrio sp.]|nr:MAG: TIGR02281 family clan AA aspartic protease [Thioalkalivibrio sp.]
MNRIRTHYRNLQVREDASPEVIRGAWKELARKWDPDQNPERREHAERVSKVIAQSYRVLADPDLRREHDAWIRMQRAAAEASDPAPVEDGSAGEWIPAATAPASGRRPLGLTLIAMAWISAFALVWWLFDDYLDRREFPNRNLVVESGAMEELVLRRNHVGHYLAPGTINGEPVVFLLDTGATQVSVPAHLAEDLGLHAGTRGRAMTANGPVEIRQTRIGELALGPFVLESVRGHINPGMSSDQVLLGMSVLRHLEFAQRDGQLILNLPR